MFARVNFKGCVEKEELVRIVERLWQQEQRHREEGDNMDDDAMCKICMDSPVMASSSSSSSSSSPSSPRSTA